MSHFIRCSTNIFHRHIRSPTVGYYTTSSKPHCYTTSSEPAQLLLSSDSVSQCSNHDRSSHIVNSTYSVKPFSQVPSPNGSLPIIGHSHLVRGYAKSNQYNQFVEKCFQELGPIFKLHYIGGFTTVHISDPSAVETLFRNEGRHPLKNPKVEELFRHFFKTRREKCTFAFETGEAWSAGRSKLNKQLMTSNINSYCSGFNTVTDRLMRNILTTQDKQGKVKDVKKLLIHWSFESAASFVIGANLDTINDPKVIELYHAVDKFSKSIGNFTTSLPFYKILPISPSYKQLSESFDDMYNMGQSYVLQHHTTKDATHNGLLQQWLNDDNFTKEEAVNNAISLLVHALDIVTNTTERIICELSKHQDIQYKLMDQVVSVLGSGGEANGDNLQRIPYLNAIIKETLRLHPISPTRTRTINKDIELLGYNIPAGTPVLANQACIANNESYFKDPHLFNPDRWSRTSKDHSIHPFAQLPFGHGPKSCWGRRFVQLKVKILLTKLVRTFLMESSSSSSVNKLSLQNYQQQDHQNEIKFIPHKI